MADDKLVQLGSLSSPFETDPVCKMRVMPETSAGRFDYQGKTYYFCAARCLERFKANPEQFLGQAKSAIRTQFAIPDSFFTCPMHPEVRQKGPGACPKCGMALEPEMFSIETEDNPELIDMSRRFRGSISLTIAILALAMSEMMPGTVGRNVVSIPLMHWIQFILATPVVLWAGWPFFVRGWRSLGSRLREPAGRGA